MFLILAWMAGSTAQENDPQKRSTTR